MWLPRCSQADPEKHGVMKHGDPHAAPHGAPHGAPHVAQVGPLPPRNSDSCDLGCQRGSCVLTCVADTRQESAAKLSDDEAKALGQTTKLACADCAVSFKAVKAHVENVIENHGKTSNPMEAFKTKSFEELTTECEK